jgi:YHS domain-containing protein
MSDAVAGSTREAHGPEHVGTGCPTCDPLGGQPAEHRPPYVQRLSRSVCRADELKDHLYERFLPPPTFGYEPLVESATTDGDGLDRLDPVCLMDVDPATAKHTVEYAGRTIAFCAPACKKQFLADPAAYLVA